VGDTDGSSTAARACWTRPARTWCWWCATTAPPTRAGQPAGPHLRRLQPDLQRPAGLNARRRPSAGLPASGSRPRPAHSPAPRHRPSPGRSSIVPKSPTSIAP
jgi:hypothetical protein